MAPKGEVEADQRSSRGSFVGIDLAWRENNRSLTGLATVDDEGRLLTSTWVRTDDEIADWVTRNASQPDVIAVDAPLVVPNMSGQRLAETLIGRAFGRYGAGAHSSNRGLPIFDPPRAETLARRFGWSTDPANPTGRGQPVCIEVYPHPAMVGLFGLHKRLAYKKGQDRQPEFLRLEGHLEAIPELRLAESTRWAEIVALVRDPRPGDLNRIEDEVDAILCAHLAWLWHHPGHTHRVRQWHRRLHRRATSAPKNFDRRRTHPNAY